MKTMSILLKTMTVIAIVLFAALLWQQLGQYERYNLIYAIQDPAVNASYEAARREAVHSDSKFAIAIAAYGIVYAGFSALYLFKSGKRLEDK